MHWSDFKNGEPLETFDTRLKLLEIWGRGGKHLRLYEINSWHFGDEFTRDWYSLGLLSLSLKEERSREQKPFKYQQEKKK